MTGWVSRPEDRGGSDLTSGQEHRDDQDAYQPTHQPAAPADDRRHDRASVRREDARRLYPPRPDVHSLPRPLAGYRHGRRLRRFQLHQAETGVRPPTINSAVAALRFFFTVTLDRPELARGLVFVREPRKIPVVLSPEQVARLLEVAPGLKYRAALSAAYGAGLRIAEVANLKVADIDSRRMLLRIEVHPA